MSKPLKITLGILAANATGAAAVGGTVLITSLLDKVDAPEFFSAILFPSFFFLPLLMGMIAAFCWRRASLKTGEYVLYSTITVAVGNAGAYLLFGEGVICLLIVSPLLLALVLAGALLGRFYFRKMDNRLRLSIFPMVLILAIGEPVFHEEKMASVTDEILIHAKPAVVWKYVNAFPPIQKEPEYWLFRIGLPAPLATTNSGSFVGADRACIFTDNLVFKEKVVEWIPEKRLTFDITELPPHPELLGHLDLHRGQFQLRETENGTLLTGTSWYTLRVHPVWYFDWWTRDITRQVHLRVMRHIKELAETEP
jgi:hypothetical protein